jgi:hypothetical protein
VIGLCSNGSSRWMVPVALVDGPAPRLVCEPVVRAAAPETYELPLQQLLKVLPSHDRAVQRQSRRAEYLRECACLLLDASVPIAVRFGTDGQLTRSSADWTLEDEATGEPMFFQRNVDHLVDHVSRHFGADGALARRLRQFKLPPPFKASSLLMAMRQAGRASGEAYPNGVSPGLWAAIECYVGLSMALWLQPASGDARGRLLCKEPRPQPLPGVVVVGFDRHLQEPGDRALALERQAWGLAGMEQLSVRTWLVGPRHGVLVWRTTYPRLAESSDLLSELTRASRLGHMETHIMRTP